MPGVYISFVTIFLIKVAGVRQLFYSKWHRIGASCAYCPLLGIYRDAIFHQFQIPSIVSFKSAPYLPHNPCSSARSYANPTTLPSQNTSNQTALQGPSDAPLCWTKPVDPSRRVKAAVVEAAVLEAAVVEAAVAVEENMSP